MGKKISVGPKPTVAAAEKTSVGDLARGFKPGDRRDSGGTVFTVKDGKVYKDGVESVDVDTDDPAPDAVSFSDSADPREHAEAVIQTTVGYIAQSERDVLQLGDSVNGVVTDAMKHLGTARIAKALQLFVAMERLKKAAASASTTMLENMGPIEHAFFQRFMDEGVDKMTVAGATVFPRTDVYPTAKADAVAEGPDGQMLQGREAMVAVIEHDEGMGHLIKKDVNLNSLRSFIAQNFTEADDAGKPVLPNALAAVIDFNVKHSLGMRKA